MFLLVFSVVALVRLQMQFINNFVVLTWACASGFNINIDKTIFIDDLLSFVFLTLNFMFFQ